MTSTRTVLPMDRIRWGAIYMRHNQSILMAILKKKNMTVSQKTLAVSDFYFRSPEWE